MAGWNEKLRRDAGLKKPMLDPHRHQTATQPCKMDQQAASEGNTYRATTFVKLP